MKIGFFGDGPWAERALLPLMQDPRYTIVFVAVRASRPDPKLTEMAERHGIPLLCPASVNSDESLADIGGFGADLHVSMSYDQILRAPILGLPPRGTLNCHAGALPFYRGRNPLTWAIINGEPEFGVTVHWVDLGIDTGDIVRQVKTPIEANDTYATLLASAEELCASTLVQAISDVHGGTDQRIVQATIDPVGMYCCRRREGDEEIDWTSNAVSIERFVRGAGASRPRRPDPVEGYALCDPCRGENRWGQALCRCGWRGHRSRQRRYPGQIRRCLSAADTLGPGSSRRLAWRRHGSECVARSAAWARPEGATGAGRGANCAAGIQAWDDRQRGLTPPLAAAIYRSSCGSRCGQGTAVRSRTHEILA